MNHIKKYNLFKESISNDYSIYEFFNLINYHYGDKVPQSKVKAGSDKFIGEGIYDKVKLMVDDIVEKFEGIDLKEIESRFTYFSDHYEKECHIFFSILGSNFKKYYEDVDERYNSSRGFNINKINKETIINDIISDIISPTLSGTEERIRQTEEQIYVNDPKWNCVNFNIDDYIFQNKLKMQLYTKSHLKKYSVDKYLNDMYVPAIYIQIGDYDDKMSMNLLEVEQRLDSVLDKRGTDILFDISYSHIIWDSSRFKRRFDPNTNIYQYNIKFILE